MGSITSSALLIIRRMPHSYMHVKAPHPAHFMADHCPDHWDNMLFFGHCWKHDEYGRMKPLFANPGGKK